MLNIAKALAKGISAGLNGLNGLRLPPALGITPAMSKVGSSVLSSAVTRSLLGAGWTAAEYGIAATLSLPEYVIVKEIRPVLGGLSQPGAKKRGGGGGDIASNPGKFRA